MTTNLVPNSRNSMVFDELREFRDHSALATGATSGVTRRMATRRFSASRASVFTFRYCSP